MTGPGRTGRVGGVYLAGSAGLPMFSVESAVAVAGQGLLGDRYQAGTGEWSQVHSGTMGWAS